jgi:hypothetical protein
MLAMHYIDTSSNVPFPDIHGPLVLTMLLLIKNQQMLKWCRVVESHPVCLGLYNVRFFSCAGNATRKFDRLAGAREVATCDAKMFSTGIRSAKPEFSNRG